MVRYKQTVSLFVAAKAWFLQRKWGAWRWGHWLKSDKKVGLERKRKELRRQKGKPGEEKVKNGRVRQIGRENSCLCLETKNGKFRGAIRP